MPGPDATTRAPRTPDSMGAPGRWRDRSEGRTSPAATIRGASAVRFGPYVEEHLARKRASRTCSARWLRCVEGHLAAAVEWIGPDAPLEAVDPRTIEQLMSNLLQRPNRRGETLSPRTVRHYRNSLGHLFGRAESDGLVEVETNAQALVAAVRAIPGTRHLCLEEGTLSGWLYEVLSPHVVELVVAGVSESQGAKNDKLDPFARAEQLRMSRARAGRPGRQAPRV
jgi:hypothetical protein